MSQLLWEYLEGPLYQYLETAQDTDALASATLIKIIDQYLGLWYFNEFPDVNSFTRLLTSRFCTSLRDQRHQNFDGMIDRINTCQIDMNQINTNFDFWAVQLNNLKKHGDKFKVIGNFSEETLERDEKTRRLMEILKDSRDSIIATFLARRKLNKLALQDPLPPDYDTTTTLTKDIESSNTSFQNLILYTLDLLRKDRLRKYGEYCYVEMFTDKEKPMHAWKEHMTIKEYIFRNITKERDYTQWKNLTNPRDNDKHIVENIKEAEHPEFPSLKLKR